MTDHSDIAKHLRNELGEMANRASVDFELWNRFSNRVLTGADAIEAQAKQISTIRNQAMKACEWRDDAILKKDARIAELEAAIDGVLAVVDASKMVPKLNLRGAGGQTIAANIRASDYLRVDAWPFEKLRDARTA